MKQKIESIGFYFFIGAWAYERTQSIFISAIVAIGSCLVVTVGDILYER